jgi:hypothetical protein
VAIVGIATAGAEAAIGIARTGMPKARDVKPAARIGIAIARGRLRAVSASTAIGSMAIETAIAVAAPKGVRSIVPISAAASIVAIVIRPAKVNVAASAVIAAVTAHAEVVDGIAIRIVIVAGTVPELMNRLRRRPQDLRLSQARASLPAAAPRATRV